MWVCVVFRPFWFGQAFENLDREGKGFLTSQGIKEVVGLDFEAEEVRPFRVLFLSDALFVVCLN